MIDKRTCIGLSAVCVMAGTLVTTKLLHETRHQPFLEARTHRQSSVAQASAPAAPLGAPPITPVTYRPIPMSTAEELNEAVPLLTVGPPAPSFSIPSGTQAWERASHCLAQAVYYEAGAESYDGQRAVAQVVLNRVRSPAFPNSICGVVYEGAERATGCQFTFACDGSLRRDPDSRGWRRAMAAATTALTGHVFSPVGYATHYHANYVVPYWAASMAKVREIGAHDFYRWPGSWRPRTYFSQHYANVEPGEAVPPVSEAAVPSTVVAAVSLPEQGKLTKSKAVAAPRPDGPEADKRAHMLIAAEHPPELVTKWNQTVALAADRVNGSLSHTAISPGKPR